MRRKRREEDGMSPLLSKLEVKIRERVKHKSTVKENGSSRRNPQGRKAKPAVAVRRRGGKEQPQGRQS